MNIEDTFHTVFPGKYPWPDDAILEELKSSNDVALREFAVQIEELIDFVHDWVWSLPESRKWAEVEPYLHTLLSGKYPWYSKGMRTKIAAFASWYGWREVFFPF
jgi:hypothetical protein